MSNQSIDKRDLEADVAVIEYLKADVAADEYLKAAEDELTEKADDLYKERCKVLQEALARGLSRPVAEGMADRVGLSERDKRYHNAAEKVKYARSVLGLEAVWVEAQTKAVDVEQQIADGYTTLVNFKDGTLLVGGAVVEWIGSCSVNTFKTICVDMVDLGRKAGRLDGHTIQGLKELNKQVVNLCKQFAQVRVDVDGVGNRYLVPSDGGIATIIHPLAVHTVLRAYFQEGRKQQAAA